MSRAGQLAAHALVLGLGLGAPSGAPAQTVGAAWQATPASVLKSSLRTVVAAQDKYRASHPGFASTLEALQVDPGADVKIQILAPVRQAGAPRQLIVRGRVGAASSLSAR